LPTLPAAENLRRRFGFSITVASSLRLELIGAQRRHYNSNQQDIRDSSFSGFAVNYPHETLADCGSTLLLTGLYGVRRILRNNFATRRRFNPAPRQNIHRPKSAACETILR